MESAGSATAQPSAEELVRQLSLLRSVADSVPVLVAYVDQQHRFRYANRCYQEWFGLDPDELAGRHLRDVDGDEAYAIALPYLKRAESGEFVAFEARMPYPNGARDVEVTYVPDGAAAAGNGFFLIASDLSEHRAAESAGREEVLRLVRIVDSAPAMSYTFDVNGNLEYATPEFERFFGITAAEWRGWQSAEFVHIDDVDEVLALWSESLENGTPFEAEFRARRHDGEYRWLLSRGVPIRGADGSVERWVAVNFDIHERKQLEEERERVMAELERALIETAQAATRLDAVLRITPVGIVFVDREYRFVRVNEAAAEINGLPIEAHIGRTVEDVVPGVESQRALFDRVFANNEVIHNVEVSGSTAAVPGEVRYWLASYYPVPGQDGSVELAGVVFREVTDKKREEQERERLVAELRLANATKDEFLGMVSHELKTPITTILGNAQILRTKGEQLDRESRGTALQDIETESRRLHSIIENLLVLARLDRGQALSVEPVFVRRVLQETVAEFAERSGRPIELDAKDDYAFVLADPVYIEQVIENLLSNAHKYSPPGEGIKIRAAQEGSELCVRVIDHGLGFSPEEAERLFQPFYRSERTAQHASGVGVGLAVCKRIIEALGGRMWAEPGADRGAEIGFALPIADEEAGDGE